MKAGKCDLLYSSHKTNTILPADNVLFITYMQTFVFTDSPLHDVDSLLFSYSSKYLALVGQRGLSVVEIPTRWGKFSAYDGGNEEVLCKYVILIKFITFVPN